MDIATKLTDLTNDLRACRQAIKEKGGEISVNAGFSEVAEKILELPSGTSSVGTVIDDSISVFKQVPVNSISHCYISKLGGYTHVVPDENTELAPIRLENAKPMGLRVHGANLIPFPYYSNRGAGDYTQSGVTFTIGEDRVVNLTGTGTALIEFTLFQGFLPAGIYTMSGINASNDTAYYMQMRGKDGNWYKNAATIDGGVNRGTFEITAAEANQYYCRLNIRVVPGVKFTNIKLCPMLNRGTTAIPYTDYHAPIEITLPESITSLANLGLGLYDNEYNECDFVNDKYIQRCNTKTFVGTETFNVSALGSRRRYNISVPTDCRFWKGDKYLSKQKCDYLETDALVDSINKNDTIKNKMTQWQTGWFFYVDGTDFTDLATWKSYLAEHNMEVVYELEEEEVTDIGTSDFNPLIEVEGGGSIEFITDSGYAPNSTVVFQTI